MGAAEHSLLFLNNDDVQRVLKMGDALRVLEDGHRELAKRELVARPLVDLIAGTATGRARDDEISASGGVRGGGGKQGLQFVTVSSLVYDRARAAGLGREIPTDWFLQDIRD